MDRRSHVIAAAGDKHARPLTYPALLGDVDVGHLAGVLGVIHPAQVQRTTVGRRQAQTELVVHLLRVNQVLEQGWDVSWVHSVPLVSKAEDACSRMW